jgi:hypothetical protein
MLIEIWEGLHPFRHRKGAKFSQAMMMVDLLIEGGRPLAASLECLTKKLFFMVMSGWIIVPFTLLVAAL